MSAFEIGLRWLKRRSRQPFPQGTPRGRSRARPAESRLIAVRILHGRASAATGRYAVEIRKNFSKLLRARAVRYSTDDEVAVAPQRSGRSNQADRVLRWGMANNKKDAS